MLPDLLRCQLLQMEATVVSEEAAEEVVAEVVA